VASRDYPLDASNLGLIYRPVLLSQASSRLVNLKLKIDVDTTRTALVADPDRRGIIRWEKYLTEQIDRSKVEEYPDPQARFANLEAPLNDVKLMNTLEKDFLNWAHRNSEIMVLGNESLEIYAGPEVTEGEFRTRCAEAARKASEAEIKKVTKTYETKLRTLKDRLEREQRELDQDKEELSSRKWEEGAHVAETVAGLFGMGRKRKISSSLTKRRMTAQAKSDVEESVDAIKDMQEQIAAIEAEKAAVIQSVNEQWGQAASQVTEIPLSPLKKDVLLDFFGVAWMPFFLAQAGKETFELPGFSVK